MREVKTGNPSLAAKILNITPEREREIDKVSLKKTNLKIELGRYIYITVDCHMDIVKHSYRFTAKKC